MQTVHIWPIHHLLLENHPRARHFRKLIPQGELLVVLEDGEIVEVEPPPNDDFEFRDTGIVQLLERAWSRGLAASTKEGKLRAPDGWILWKDVQPGMLVYDGHDQHALRYPESFEYLRIVTAGFGKQEVQKQVADVAFLASERTTEHLWSFDMVKREHDIFKVVRQGLTQAQCVEIREMFNRGDLSVLSPTYVL